MFFGMPYVQLTLAKGKYFTVNPVHPDLADDGQKKKTEADQDGARNQDGENCDLYPEQNYLPSCRLFQAVTHPPDGFNELGARSDIYLVSQTSDIDIHDIGLRIKMIPPDMLQDLCPRKHPVRGTHEKFQKAEFTGRQIDRIFPDSDFAADAIDHEATTL